MKTIGFIGYGNMASAIAKGMLSSGFAKPEALLVFRKDPVKLAELGKEGIRVAASNEEVVRGADIVIVAVKPHLFASVLPPLRNAFAAGKPLVISVAAGVGLARIAALIGEDIPVVRAMPNVNARIGASMTGLCGNVPAQGEHLEAARALYATVGRTTVLDESMFGVFSAVAGASPAFVFMFIEGLAKGGLKAGMSKREAVMAAAQAVMGSAQLILESGDAPMALADAVCSPGGTTIAGVAALEENAFIATVMRAVEATTQRDAELAAKS